jgi:hypothetical protein
MSSTRLGRWSALTVFLVGVAYVVALVTGFATYGLRRPIGDPLLAVMEVLTLLSALALLVMMAAVYARASRSCRTFAVVALAFMTLVVGTTGAVHVVGLTALRQLGWDGLVWPSPAYALDVLAWDLFLGLSLLFAAPVFERGGLTGRIRGGLLLCGMLCIAGLLGPVMGDMRLQLVGVLGYAGVLPVVCLMLARLFHADGGARRAAAV